jgi:CBS domain-containing protein
MRPPSKSRLANKSKAGRDYKAEYARRKERGLAAGKSVSAARGHPKAADLPKPNPGPINRDDPLEHALKMMRKGATQAKAAKVAGVTVERLRIHRERHTTSRRVGRLWDIFDSRPASFWIATNGSVQRVTLANDDGGLIGDYWNGVDRFFDTTDPEVLDPFVGRGVRDFNGRLWLFETRPNVLLKMKAAGDLSFTQIYADTIGEA